MAGLPCDELDDELLLDAADFAGVDLPPFLPAALLPPGFAAAAGLATSAENNAATMNHGRERTHPGTDFMAKLSNAKGPGQVKHGRGGFRALRTVPG